MGLFSKLVKKSIGVKLVKKAISKDPIGSRVISKSKGAQALGLVNKKPAAIRAAVAGSKIMNTGGNQPPALANPVQNRGTTEAKPPIRRGNLRNRQIP